MGPVLLTDFPPPKDTDDPLYAREKELFERLAADTAVVAPLRARRQVLGVLTLARTRSEAPLTEDTLSLVEDLAHRVALAVDNARLHAEAHHAAERLQRSLLPDLPTDGPLDVVARYRPASASARVGGDWYDAFVMPDGAMTLIIGDVAGHDLRAAVMMSQTRNMLRGIACDRKEPPGKILARLDAAHHILYPDQTLTCIYALVDRRDARIVDQDVDRPRRLERGGDGRGIGDVELDEADPVRLGQDARTRRTHRGDDVPPLGVEV
ncbi:hypothetical protein SMICM304S_05210 [Streptomyces microflavus]